MEGTETPELLRTLELERVRQDVESLASDSDDGALDVVPDCSKDIGGRSKKKRKVTKEDVKAEPMKLISFKEVDATSTESIDLFREVQELYACVQENMNKAVDRAHKYVAPRNKASIEFKDAEAASAKRCGKNQLSHAPFTQKAAERLKARREAVASKFVEAGHQMRALKAKINAFGAHVTHKEQTEPRVLLATIADAHEKVEEAFRRFRLQGEQGKLSNQPKKPPVSKEKTKNSKFATPQRCAA